VRTDERDGAMSEVTCRRCATVVLVRKSSVAQTSIQWRGDAAATCTELAERRAANLHPAQIPSCEALRDSIDEAVRAGRVPVE
jgi:hypothetical protein